MSEEQINEAVARECGWMPESGVMHYDGGEIPWTIWLKNGKKYSFAPKYTGDLNACHEMESVIIERGLEMEYREALGDECGQYHIIWNAKPLQRCCAFLRTLGKWKEAA